MRYNLEISCNGVIFNRILCIDNDQCVIEIDGSFIIYVYKYNSQHYDIRAFFYNSKRIYTHNSIYSLKDVYCYIKYIINLELIDVQQK